MTFGDESLGGGHGDSRRDFREFRSKIGIDVPPFVALRTGEARHPDKGHFHSSFDARSSQLDDDHFAPLWPDERVFAPFELQEPREFRRDADDERIAGFRNGYLLG